LSDNSTEYQIPVPEPITGPYPTFRSFSPFRSGLKPATGRPLNGHPPDPLQTFLGIIPSSASCNKATPSTPRSRESHPWIVPRSKCPFRAPFVAVRTSPRSCAHWRCPSRPKAVACQPGTGERNKDKKKEERLIDLMLTMNPNPTGYPAFQQHPNPMLSAAAGYPVPSQNPNSHQVAFYANSAAFSQVKAPQGHPMQQQPQQHPFGVVQLQTTGPAGAMIPAGISQQVSGKSSSCSEGTSTSLALERSAVRICLRFLTAGPGGNTDQRLCCPRPERNCASPEGWRRVLLHLVHIHIYFAPRAS
jgi:hypothetical protein